ncbi:oxidoreductase [uncultured Roseobacter sp.]|uniref:oxidoreductase n=1 Tax=uncultured Roseobacter sp. TaxID=114847 RepID=UPI0026149D9A|nr:oxidoreductase [uncultured Roseobacter sp.]
MTDIAQPLTLPGGATLRNRLVKSAMSEALANAHGNPTEALIDLYTRWGAGGAGLLITGNTPVDRLHLEHAGNVVLDDATDLAAMSRLARAAQGGGARVLTQLAHAGRQVPAAINPAPLSISDQPLDLPGYGTPRTARDTDLAAVVAQFVRSAELAKAAGFDGVEVHAAHGYLLSSALSPRINTRTDRWGGSLGGRARLTLEVVRVVRAAVPAPFILAVKLNAADFQKGGFELPDAVKVAVMLEAEGVDLIEVSGGTFEAPTAYQHSKPSTRAREAYFLDYAQAIKSALGIPLMVTGGFRSRPAMDAALAQRQTDLIGMGRPFITEPGVAARLLTAPDARAPAPEQGFPPAAELPRGAVLNWFCSQLARAGRPDPSLPLLQGHADYLARSDRLTRRLLAARAAAPARCA